MLAHTPKWVIVLAVGHPHEQWQCYNPGPFGQRPYIRKDAASIIQFFPFFLYYAMPRKTTKHPASETSPSNETGADPVGANSCTSKSNYLQAASTLLSVQTAVSSVHSVTRSFNLEKLALPITLGDMSVVQPVQIGRRNEKEKELLSKPR
jgi:hypothetical protein